MEEYINKQLEAFELMYADRGANIQLTMVENQVQTFLRGFPQTEQRIALLRAKYSMPETEFVAVKGEEINFAKLMNDPDYNPLKDDKIKKDKEAAKKEPTVVVEVDEAIDLDKAFEATTPEELKSAFGNSTAKIRDFVNEHAGTKLETKKVLDVWDAFDKNREKLKASVKK
jgi:cytochrome c1